MCGEDVRERIEAAARMLVEKIHKGDLPEISVPMRSMSNVIFEMEDRYYHLGEKTTDRVLDYRSARTFAQMLRLMALLKSLIQEDERASKRELYYISKNWDEARFDEQSASDSMLDDLEAMLRTIRERLRVFPEEKGGEVAGPLKVIDRDPKSGQEIKVDCRRMGQGAWSIPVRVEELRFETEAEFILVIETAGMFQRLNDHSYWDKADCILVSMGGVPTRACRRFVRRLSDQKRLPVYAFVDGDPYGYANIYRTMKVGSANSAHITEHFCVPDARFLGVMPTDIERYDLPTHPLGKQGCKRAKDALENDPFFQSHDQWRWALGRMLRMGVRAEQQAFAKHGLNMVMERYLPEKLDDPDSFYA